MKPFYDTKVYIVIRFQTSIIITQLHNKMKRVHGF